jgi:hypothetical protein
MFRFAQHGLYAVASVRCTRWLTPWILKLQIRAAHRGFPKKPLGIKGLGRNIEFIADSNGRKPESNLVS